MTVGHHAVGLWNCLQANDRASGQGGREGFREKDPRPQEAMGDTGPVAQDFLLTVSITAHVPGPLGRGAPEILYSHLRQTKNRAKSSWLVTEGCGDTTRLGQACRK